MTTAPTAAPPRPNAAALRPAGAAPELGSAERKALRALAHHLDPVVIIGDAGLSAAVYAEADRALAAHGLIKIRVHGDDRERRLAILDELCATLGCAPVQAIGKLLVVWREKPEIGTGGDAGTARRRPGRQTKKAAGAGAKAPIARRKTSTAAKTPAAKPKANAAKANTAARAPAARHKADAAPARKPASGVTRSARPGSGTRARRRAP